MCRLRPLATAIAPLVMRDLPASIAADGALHTWASYHRTLEGVVLPGRVAGDLRSAAVPITLLHGQDDRTAAVHHVSALADGLRRQGVVVDLQVVEGDHHLAVRRPAAVAAALGEILGDRPSPPGGDGPRA